MTVMPVVLPPTSAELAVPYLTAEGFQAFPTWLDLDNLIPGGAAAMQADELNDVLLTASRWCVTNCEEMPLHGHYVQGENQRTRASGGGRLYIRPRHIPARGIVSFSYGADPSAMTALALPDATMWNEDGREISFRPGGAAALFTGPAIEFGSRLSAAWPTYVTWSYVAGYPATVIGTGGVAASASTILLADATSVLPGDVLRVYDNAGGTGGISEALTVAATYTPAVPTVPPTPTAVPLAAATAHAHAAGVGITGMPRGILQAVICYTVALLMREDVADEAPVSGFGPAARATAAGTGKAGGLINDALEFLAPFRPTWRS